LRDIKHVVMLMQENRSFDHFCSVMGPTWPNRMYWMTAMIDPEAMGGGPILRNIAPPEGYKWTTYAERLQKAGVSWKVYQQEDGHGHSMPPGSGELRAAARRLRTRCPLGEHA
jgi:phospholipase C